MVRDMHTSIKPIPAAPAITPLQAAIRERPRGTQNLLAEMLGVRHSLVSMWVNGHVPVPEHHQPALAAALERTVEQLFGAQSVPCPVDTGSDQEAPDA